MTDLPALLRRIQGATGRKITPAMIAAGAKVYEEIDWDPDVPFARRVYVAKAIIKAALLAQSTPAQADKTLKP